MNLNYIGSESRISTSVANGSSNHKFPHDPSTSHANVRLINIHVLLPCHYFHRQLNVHKRQARDEIHLLIRSILITYMNGMWCLMWWSAHFPQITFISKIHGKLVKCVCFENEECSKILQAREVIFRIHDFLFNARGID